MTLTKRPLRLAAIAAAGLTTFALAAPATAQENPEASTTGTVNVAIRSVTVTPNEFAFGDCTLDDESTGDSLAFPNGQCVSPDVTVTNGETPARIFVRATDFADSDGNPAWERIGPSASFPGTDQARMGSIFSLPESTGGVFLTGDNCDIGWSGIEPGESCIASPGQTTVREVFLQGPESTTNPSPSFSTTITWTALP